MNINHILLKVRPVEFAELLKSLFHITHREVQIGQRLFWLDPASGFGSLLIADGFYEKDVSSIISSLLKPGDIFVDLGANEGYFSLLASEIVGESGHVYSIEPQARLWPVIIRNFLLNNKINYTIVPYAIGETEGFIDIILFSSLNTGASTAIKSMRRRSFQKQKTRIIPLSKVLDNFHIKRINLLKIDIEGFELNALRSLGKRLEDGSVENIIVELHPNQLQQLGQTVADVQTLLHANGYRIEPSSHCEYWKRI